LVEKFDAFLKEEGIYEETQAKAIQKVVAWQLAKAMEKKRISKAQVASRLKTSRTQVDRLRDFEKNEITLSSLQRAAAIVEQRVNIDLV
jgi:antitoxin HicB